MCIFLYIWHILPTYTHTSRMCWTAQGKDNLTIFRMKILQKPLNEEKQGGGRSSSSSLKAQRYLWKQLSLSLLNSVQAKFQLLQVSSESKIISFSLGPGPMPRKPIDCSHFQHLPSIQRGRTESSPFSWTGKSFFFLHQTQLPNNNFPKHLKLETFDQEKWSFSRLHIPPFQAVKFQIFEIGFSNFDFWNSSSFL